MRRAEKAKELFELIMQICNTYEELSLSGSIGISFYPQDGLTLDELYARADEALYEAKQKGKNRIEIAVGD